MSTRRRRVPVRFRRSAARLLLHGCWCMGNGVRMASLLAISAAAHRHKSTRIPKRANSRSNAPSCAFNSDGKPLLSESRATDGKRGAAQLPSAGLKATIWQLAGPLRAEERHRKNRKKKQDGSLRRASRGPSPAAAAQSVPRTPQNLAAGLQTRGNQVRSTALLLRFLFQSAARGPIARCSTACRPCGPRLLGGAAPALARPPRRASGDAQGLHCFVRGRAAAS